MAVIMCDTGIALLAYMDGITDSPTLAGVVLAASAAAGSAVYKVLFKKVIGDATYGQVALFFSIIGMINAALLWPLSLGLFLTGFETLQWEKIPWPALLSASVLSLSMLLRLINSFNFTFLLFSVANLLGNFSVALTYDLFITLGLITSVPVSAGNNASGLVYAQRRQVINPLRRCARNKWTFPKILKLNVSALDVVLYGAHFEGMKLAGMILIAVGFFLVMFPDNWPTYITRLLR